MEDETTKRFMWFFFVFFSSFFFICLSTKRVISNFSQLMFTRDRGEEKTKDGIIKEEETKTNAFTYIHMNDVSRIECIQNLIMIVCTVHNGRLEIHSVALFFSL